MAFINKVGNLLKYSAVKHINQELSASTPTIYQAIRSMSSAKLFVGGISYSTDDMSMREAFARYGEIIDARVIMDRETGRSRGFGFVTFATSEDASSAIQGMDGQDLHGRMIRVNYATERLRPGFGGGGGSGYGGSSYGGNDYNRTGSYGSGGYGGRDSYGGGDAGTGYTGVGNVNSGDHDGSGSGSGKYGVPESAGAGNYQFNENSGGDFGSLSSEHSSNTGLGYDNGKFGGNQNDRTGRDDDGSIEPFEDNPRVRENNAW